MKILIVAGTFPPFAPASASRANKFAKYLENKGHEVNVLAPRLPMDDMPLKPEISEDKIAFTKFYDINDFPSECKYKIKNFFKPNEENSTIDQTIAQEPQKQEYNQKKESAISIIYRSLTNIPDGLIGWYPEAIRKGKKLMSDWQPDIIFSTAPPYTGFVVARKLSKIFNVPWVADYRDLWIDKSHPQSNSFRGKINNIFERWLLSNCSGVITVTEHWKNSMAKRYKIPVITAMNGYDPADFNPDTKTVLYPDHYTILYAGVLYEGRRDPSALFEALGKMGPKKERFKVLIYTFRGMDSLNDHQKQLIEKYDLHEQVIVRDFIPQSDLLNIEMGVDELLLLRWNDPGEDGVIAGKLFEYIGAGKDILSLGSLTGEAADIIRDNDFGFVSNDADEIIQYLENQLTKKGQNKIDESPNDAQKKFKRSIQFDKMIDFMDQVLGQ